MISHRTTRELLLAAVSTAAFVLSQEPSAAPLIADNYLRLSPGEAVNAPFISTAGAATMGSYSGLVEIVVMGTGFSYGLNENDAFYCTLAADERCPAPGVILDPQYYQLNIGMTGLPFSGGEANNIDQFIVFIENVGPVGPGTLPAYDSVEHIYHFVVNLPIALPSVLSFGVSDGIYADNGGSYDISVFQLAPKMVPEPGSLWLALVGLALPLGLRLTTRNQIAGSQDLDRSPDEGGPAPPSGHT